MDKTQLLAREAAEILEVGHRHVIKLIHQGKLRAELQDQAPVPYYLIDRESVLAYKAAPKSKGGRPRKESGEHDKEQKNTTAI